MRTYNGIQRHDGARVVKGFSRMFNVFRLPLRAFLLIVVVAVALPVAIKVLSVVALVIVAVFVLSCLPIAAGLVVRTVRRSRTR